MMNAFGELIEKKVGLQNDQCEIENGLLEGIEYSAIITVFCAGVCMMVRVADSDVKIVFRLMNDEFDLRSNVQQNGCYLCKFF